MKMQQGTCIQLLFIPSRLADRWENEEHRMDFSIDVKHEVKVLYVDIIVELFDFFKLQHKHVTNSKSPFQHFIITS